MVIFDEQCCKRLPCGRLPEFSAALDAGLTIEISSTPGTQRGFDRLSRPALPF